MAASANTFASANATSHKGESVSASAKSAKSGGVSDDDGQLCNAVRIRAARAVATGLAQDISSIQGVSAAAITFDNVYVLFRSNDEFLP